MFKMKEGHFRSRPKRVSFNEIKSAGKLIHQNHRGYGKIYRMPKGELVKCFVSRGFPLSLIRHLFKCSKAHKQLRSAMRLLELGLPTPEPFGVYRFHMRDSFESAYVCDYLEDARPLDAAMLDMEHEQRAAVLRELASQMGVMAQNGVLFIDFHLGNVLLDSQSKIWWIDPELWFSARKVRQQFWARMERMHRKCNLGLLTEAEWRFFCECLNHEVSMVCGSYPTREDHG